MKIDEMQYGQVYDEVPEGIDKVPSHAKRTVRIATMGGDCVLCNPTYQQYKRWRSVSMKVDGDMGQAFETLFVDTCIAFGTFPSLKDLLADWGGIPNSDEAIKAMRALCGMAVVDVGKASTP